MSHFDDIDGGAFSSTGVQADVLGPQLMGDGMVAVPEGEI
jgi:hypothetical protein